MSEAIKTSPLKTECIASTNSLFEVFLVKGEKSSIEIEADDNLHDIINYEVAGGTLRITSLRDVSGAKKFAIRINYTTELKLITAKNESSIHALADLELDNITIKNKTLRFF